MNGSQEEHNVENFLKINTIWSKAEENLVMKEEIVSDFEPESPGDTEQEFTVTNLSENAVKNQDNLKVISFDSNDKKKKNDNPQLINEESKTNDCQTLICSHDVKNFKIVRRKLRCGDCKSLVCPECYKVVVFPLQSHLSGCDTNPVTSYSCKMCHLNFCTLCALQAHLRVHSMSSPYVCPDCGLLYNNINFLILHLINKCYHVYKIVRYKCKVCPDVYFNHEMFVQHIQLQHMESLFRCSYCSSLFSNTEEFKHHMNAVHQKQKVQYLSYFLCSLCSDMVIPRFMLEKHLFLHCNNIESYEMDYQCICGNTFNSIGAFRAHIQNCQKKKILPSNWSFLHKKLSNQEFISEDCKQSSYKTCWSPNTEAELHIKTSNLFKPQNKNNGIKEDVSGNPEILKKDNISESVAKNFKDNIPNCIDTVSEAMESCNSEIEVRVIQGSEANAAKSETEMISENVITQSEIESTEVSKNEDSLKVDNHDKIIFTSNISDLPLSQPKKEFCEDVTTLNDENENDINAFSVINNCKEPENFDLIKNFYNHIPCDHLGYVTKTQSSESTDKDLEIYESYSSSACEDKLSNKKFNLINVLDEKTGLISTKNVPVENLNENEFSCQENFNWNEKIQDTLVPNGELKNVNSGKSNLKFSGHSFFTCPFCVVKFQKHKAAFHQFKLHMESYHPDAALSITVKEGENEKPESNNSFLLERDKATLKYLNDIETPMSVKDKFKYVEGKIRHPSLKYNNSLSQGIIKPIDEEVYNSDKDCWFEDNQSSPNRCDDNDPNKEKEKLDPKLSSYSEKRKFYEDEKENVSRESNLMLKTSKENEEKDLCWTVNISFQKNQDKSIDLEETDNALTSPCVNTTKIVDTDQCSFKNSGGNFKSFKEQSSIILNKKINSLDKPFSIEFQKLTMLEQKKNYTLDETSDPQKEECDIVFNNKDEKNKNENMTVHQEGKMTENANTVQIALDFEDGCPTSKDSNSSADFSQTEKVYNMSKSEEREKCRRESEVWSEFYESLMLAEKLKKKKEKKYQSKSEEPKTSLVSDYSNKRIVKKPKRFRESSESGGSCVENENSCSEAEFLLSNNDLGCNALNEDIEESEKKSDDDENKKRETLLNKLQKIDTRLLDYLFDLVNNKEKYVDLYKRSYTQDLRSYRKKVLKGIKQRGRPHKLLRYPELLKKKDSSQLLLDKEVFPKETDQQDIQKKISNLPLVINKTGEKKRGRPRKIIDSSKIKNRRRSDKEVNFIEKNFEREENDLTPSKRKRKLSSKLQYYKKISLALTDDKDDFSSGQVIVNKSLDSNRKFSCAVCKEVFTLMTDFREHILIHRMEENSYQCMECGECFVVRPSLEKHLHAFHKIKNTDKYILENQCCNIKKETGEVDNEPLKENQCKVCKDQFDRPIDLTKHFRIHGMAFLKEVKREGKK